MNEDALRQRFHSTVEDVHVGVALPPMVMRKVRTRQTGIVGIGALSLVMVVAIGLFLSGDGMTDPAPMEPALPASEEGVIPMARGTENGITWEMKLHPEGGEAVRQEQACITALGERSCLNLEGYSFDVASIDVRYIRGLNRTLIVVKTPPGVDGPSIRELSGTNWAGLEARPYGSSDEPAYWYRFLDGNDAEGVISVGGRTFNFAVRQGGAHTEVRAGGDEFPELEGLPGEKELIDSGTDGGGYSVIVRRTSEELCLHLNDEEGCRSADAPVEPLRLWVTKFLACEQGEDCGSDSGLVVVAGEISAEVTMVGIRDEHGTSFVHLGEQGRPFGSGCCFFSTFVYGNPGDDVELIAFNGDDDELASTRITY